MALRSVKGDCEDGWRRKDGGGGPANAHTKTQKGMAPGNSERLMERCWATNNGSLLQTTIHFSPHPLSLLSQPLAAMSDSEGDIDDELLELAGATEKKRKRSQQNTSSKRRKAE